MCCEDETISCVISWVGYMPAMRTPNLYSYCLSLLLVLLAVTGHTWQPAHSELRLHAQRQMCCEDETNSCVISWVGYMPAMRTPNLYSYCLSLLLVLLAVTGHTWQPAHSELRLLAQRQMCCEDETISCVISWVGYMPAMRTPNLYSYCLSLLLVLLAVTENAWQPILSWDCMLTGRCAVKMKQIPALSAELAICQPCGPQICIRIVWAFYLFYLLWLRMLDSPFWVEIACSQADVLWRWNKFLRYQLSWLYASHADPKFLFVLSEPSTCATCYDWEYLAASPFWVEIACSQADVLWRWNKFLRYQLSWLYAGHADPKFVFVLSEPSTCATCCDWEYLAAGPFWVEIACSEADVLWRWNKFLRYQLSWLYAGHADTKFVFVLSEPSTCATCCDWECLTAHSELRLHAHRQMCCEDETNSCVISWVGYMPAMRTPNLYSYCLSLLLVLLLSVTGHTWQPAHSGLRLHAHRQMCCEDETISCVISWVGYMPAMPTPNLYSYCLSLLLVLLAVTENAWQPAHSELRLHAHRQMCCEDETNSCVISWVGYMPAMRTHNLYSYCLRLLLVLLWLRILGSRPILGWDCMLRGRCAVKMKQIPALSAELAICRPCGPQICIRIVWAFYLFYLLWLRMLGSRPILSWDCMLTGRCAVKMKQIPALSAELAICRPCGPQICIRIVWAIYLCYLLWLRILGSRPILSWDCMLRGRCAVKMKQFHTISCVISWVGYMPAMRTPNLYSDCPRLLLVLLAVTENTWQPAHSELRLYVHRQMGDVVHVYRSKPSKPSFRDVHCYVPAIFYACSMILQSRTLSCIQVPPE